MAAPKPLIATIAFFIITMALAYPWHMMLFHDIYQSMGAFTRTEPIIPLGMLAVLTQGAVIAYLYPFYYQPGERPLLQGIKFSLLVGAVVYSVMGFSVAAKIDINPIGSFLLYSFIFQCLQFVATGASLGLIYGDIKTEPAS